jgi:hypothetical protein
MASGVEHKDVVLAFLGASAALAGLVLVFLGLVVAAYGGLAGDTPKAVRLPLRRTGRVVLAPFAAGTLCILSSGVWLVWPDGGGGLYVATVSLFLAQLVLLAGAALWTLRELLWD